MLAQLIKSLKHTGLTVTHSHYVTSIEHVSHVGGDPLVAGGGGLDILDTPVGGGAVVPDLALVAGEEVHVAHLGHGPGELLEEGALVEREAGGHALGGGVVDQALVRLEQALPRDQVEVVLVVEGVRGADVEVLGQGAGGVVPSALVPERGGELGVDGRVGVEHRLEAVLEGRAVGDAEGVRAGEGHQVGHVQAAVAEGGDEGRHVEEGRRQEADESGRRRGEGVAAAEGDVEARPAGLDEGVAGGEHGDVGAGDGGPAGAVHGGADALDEVQRHGAEGLVGDLIELAAGALEQHGRVAALREAVVEEDADERRRHAHVAAERLGDVELHDVLQVRARRGVEVG
uniref:Uncharacterized protein n=1 Tax=Triticum urartu TaxID=4572 RepID=A0A8R7TNV4_TRIUA